MNKNKIASLALGGLLVAVLALRINGAMQDEAKHKAYDAGRLEVCNLMVNNSPLKMLGVTCAVEEDAHHHLYMSTPLIGGGAHNHADGCPPEQDSALQPDNSAAPQE
jgi:hypothetical protein